LKEKIKKIRSMAPDGVLAFKDPPPFTPLVIKKKVKLLNKFSSKMMFNKSSQEEVFETINP
jgi:hypothetical protein